MLVHLVDSCESQTMGLLCSCGRYMSDMVSNKATQGTQSGFLSMQISLIYYSRSKIVSR